MRLHRSAVAALIVLAGMSACGDDDSESEGGKASAEKKGGTIALLLPETKTTRYEEQDRPRFEAKVKALCPSCKLLYSNANQDAAAQQQQAEAAITNGADVLVLDAVDAKAAAATVNRAKQSEHPGDRLRPADLRRADRLLRLVQQRPVGEMQAPGAARQARRRRNGKQIVMINGSPTDPSSADYKKGAHEVLDGKASRSRSEYDTPDWSPDKAQQEMEQAITALGKDKIVGVYSANDGMAGGAIAAMKSAGIDPKTVPTTGQDSELAAIQRILTGEQYMTIYLAIKQQAESAAELAVDARQGHAAARRAWSTTRPTTAPATSRPSCSTRSPVTKDNIKDTIINDGFHHGVGDLHAASSRRACTEAGISVSARCWRSAAPRSGSAPSRRCATSTSPCTAVRSSRSPATTARASRR